MSMKQNFDELVDMAMETPGLSSMRPVVEKEILHYDIFNALDTQGLLKGIVFHGGTSLRLCRGSGRFSEDLDFAGGRDFDAAKMGQVKACIEKHIGERYGLLVTVKEPKAASERAGDHITVDKWMVTVQTVPENRPLPSQKIKIEIANVPSYTSEPVPLRLNYDFMQGQRGVLVNSESMSEILADKIVAFPTSVFDTTGKATLLDSSRLRHRDVWDMSWLMQRRGAELDIELVKAKVKDYGIARYNDLLAGTIDALPGIVASPEFKAQMSRFINAETVKRTLDSPEYLAYMTSSVGDLLTRTLEGIEGGEKVGQKSVPRPQAG